MTKSVKPLLNFVLLEIPPIKKESSGFVVVKDPKKDDRSNAQEGKVLAIGTTPGGKVLIGDEKSGDWVEPEIKVGNTVYYSSFTGHQVSNKLILNEYKNILGVKNV